MQNIIYKKTSKNKRVTLSFIIFTFLLICFYKYEIPGHIVLFCLKIHLM